MIYLDMCVDDKCMFVVQTQMHTSSHVASLYAMPRHAEFATHAYYTHVFRVSVLLYTLMRMDMIGYWICKK